LLGARIESSNPVAGRRWIVENYDARTALAELAAGRLTAGRWLGTLRRIDEAAWFARDDVAPFAAMVVDSFADACRGVGSRAARAITSSVRRLAHCVARNDQPTT
jgi:D-aspartate ligase